MTGNGTKVPIQSRPSARSHAGAAAPDCVGVTLELARRQQQRRRARAHRCPSCQTLWALRVTHHPSGVVLVCQFCGHVRLSAAQRRGDQGNASPTGEEPANTADGVVVPLRRGLRSS